ncbi:NAD(P)-dependent dehydrogenase (short-subunit alcohol dehydrogenase family) [Conyzicola lurida]|uniref:NAD(P)-dependent dehydrogenase (Short-subunit alcohol dehydrogenase family) n=1 Tax=Conyzicola lurida TaxID=1172621 RepID=A0A841AQG1_9MICO|nr:NAD(P)-dependent dehydrogenase (short-subunit alcohol dehydrogenase family) [Conyzicola lurida]
MHKLEGKTAVITGGSSGIGLATAKEFVAEGARVIITGRRQPELDAAQREMGENAIAVRGDTGSMSDLDRLVAVVAADFGRIDIFFANAGVNALAPFGEVAEDAFDRLFAINVKGTFFSAQKMLPLITNGGSIILTGSTAGSRAMDGHAVYAGTKGAIRSFARNWAMDLKHRGIRVNVLTPGPTRTSMPHTLGLTAQQLAELDDAVADMIPLGRWGRPDDLAKAALFLASDDSSFVTGTELVVDGGITA